MSPVTLEQFYTVAREDPTLLQKIAEVRSPQDEAQIQQLVELGAAKGYNFSREDIQAALQEPTQFLKSALADTDELSDWELEIVAGGRDKTDFYGSKTTFNSRN